MEFWGGSGISWSCWTICKQSAPRSRQITTPTPHHSIFTGRMLFTTPNGTFEKWSRNPHDDICVTPALSAGSASRLWSFRGGHVVCGPPGQPRTTPCTGARWWSGSRCRDSRPTWTADTCPSPGRGTSAASCRGTVPPPAPVHSDRRLQPQKSKQLSAVAKWPTL